jgi:hypothetical protein
MLFSPPNEFGEQTFNKVVGYSLALHIMVLLLPLGMEVFLGMRPTVISLKKPGRVCLGSRRNKIPSQSLPSATQTSSSNALQEQSAEQPIPKIVTPSPVESEKAAKQEVKEEKKAVSPVAKKASEKSILKVVPERKIPDLKSDKKKEVLKSEKAKEAKAMNEDLDSNKILPKEPSKKEFVAKKDVEAELKRQPVKARKDVACENVIQEKHYATGTEPRLLQGNLSLARNQFGEENVDYEEVSAADAAYSHDGMQKEFGSHLTIPEGFEEYESFTISFDIIDGKVVNVSPHTQGALVVYTAVKDALLKSTMPLRSRKNVIWVIT